MSRWAGLFGGAAILIVSMAFAALNGGQRVTVRLGFATFYQVSLPTLLLASFILGMIAMLVAGIASDLRVRRILRERLAEERDEEQARLYVDRNQTNLFREDEPQGS